MLSTLYGAKKKTTAYQHKKIIPTVKYDEGRVMIWAKITYHRGGEN